MEKSSSNYFYDVHCHAFNLSHAGLLAFANRFFLTNTLSFNDLLQGNIVDIILSVMIKKKKSGSRRVKISGS